jgi:hypothetical protein
MRYELKRNKNGIITQCDTNADGGNIYAQREEINKKALENLQRPTPGKLGNLSNLQLFNFEISDIETGANNFILKNYNTTNTFPANTTQSVMFGVNGINNKALYYNIVYINAKIVDGWRSAQNNTLPPSFVSFYLLQNNETSNTSAGTKIPQPAPLYGVGGGAVTFTTTGDVYGAQSITCDINNEVGTYAQNNDLKGFRASGLALSQIFMNFGANVTTDDIKIGVEVGVDVSSVSTTY